MAIAPEVANPIFDQLLLNLTILAAFFALLGLISGLQAVNTAIFGGLGKLLGIVPVIGGVLASPVNDVYKWVNHSLGTLVNDLDNQIGKYLHSAASEVEWLAKELKKHAVLIASIAFLQPLVAGIPFVLRLFHHAHAAAEATAHAAANTATRVAHEATAIATSTGRSVTHRLAAVENSLAGTIEYDIAGLRARVGSITHGLDRLWRQVRRLDKLTAGAALTAAVSFALARLGGTWIRCNNWKRVGRSVCGLSPGFLSDLLGIFADLWILENVCVLIGPLEVVAQDVGVPLVDALTAVGAGLCQGSIGKADPLLGPAVTVPALQVAIPAVVT